MSPKDSQRQRTLLRTKYSRSGTDSVVQFFSGSIDIAYVGITPFVMARAFGVPLRAVGVANQFARGHAVIVRHEWADQPVIRIGAVWGSTAHFVGHQWSLTLDRPCAFVNLGVAEQLGALRAGFVDAIACWEPHTDVAVRAGYERVFDATRLTSPSFNFICATDQFINEYPRIVRAIVECHSRGVEAMFRDDNVSFAEYLATIFESRLPAADFLLLLRNNYLWPDSRFYQRPDEQDPSWAALRSSEAFLQSINQISGSLDLDACFSNVTDEGGRPDEVAIGYSDSLMCAPFHASVFSGVMEANGLIPDPTTRLLSERIAHLDPENRKDLIAARSLLDSDVGAAVMKVGTAHEGLIYRMYERALSETRPPRLSGALSELDRNKILPPRLIAGAHFIRSLRNAAAHGADEPLTRSEAERALIQLLDIMDFSKTMTMTGLRRCRRCGKRVESDWLACPHCGLSIQSTCPSCGEPLRATWKACPQCGSTLEQQVREGIE